MMLSVFLAVVTLLVSSVSPRPRSDINDASLELAALRQDADLGSSVHRYKRFISTSSKAKGRPLHPLEWKNHMPSVNSPDSAASMVSNLLRGLAQEVLQAKPSREVPDKRFIGLVSRQMGDLKQPDHKGDLSIAVGSLGKDKAPSASDLISGLMASRDKTVPSAEGAIALELEEPSSSMGDPIVGHDAPNLSSLEIRLRELLRKKLTQGEKFPGVPRGK